MNTTSFGSTNQTDSFTTSNTQAPATVVKLKNLVVLSPLNNDPISRAIVNPDEQFKNVKMAVTDFKIFLIIHY